MAHVNTRDRRTTEGAQATAEREELELHNPDAATTHQTRTEERGGGGGTSSSSCVLRGRPFTFGLVSVSVFLSCAATILVIVSIVVPSWLISRGDDGVAVSSSSAPIRLNPFQLCHGAYCSALPDAKDLTNPTCTSGASGPSESAVQGYLRASQALTVLGFLLLLVAASTSMHSWFSLLHIGKWETFVHRIKDEGIRRRDAAYFQQQHQQQVQQQVQQQYSLQQAPSYQGSDVIGELNIAVELSHAAVSKEVEVCLTMEPSLKKKTKNTQQQQQQPKLNVATVSDTEAHNIVVARVSAAHAAELSTKIRNIAHHPHQGSAGTVVTRIRRCRMILTISALALLLATVALAVGIGLFDALVNSKLNCGASFCDVLSPITGGACGRGPSYGVALAAVVSTGVCCVLALGVGIALRRALVVGEASTLAIVQDLEALAVRSERLLFEALCTRLQEQEQQQQQQNSSIDGGRSSGVVPVTANPASSSEKRGPQPYTTIETHPPTKLAHSSNHQQNASSTTVNISRHPSPKLSRSNSRRDSNTIQQQQQAPLPQFVGDTWSFEAHHQLYWSSKRGLFFDPRSHQYYDPESDMWYDGDKWYSLSEKKSGSGLR